MRWRDFNPPTGSREWQGLDLLVERGDLCREAPVFRVCAGQRRIRVACAGEPVSWAHVHGWHYGLWILLTERTESWRVVPPITSRIIAGIDATPGTEAWWKLWSRWFAGALVESDRTPLSAGRWALTPARASGSSSPRTPAATLGWSYGGWAIAWVRELATCLDADRLRWESWFINGSGALLRARRTAPASGSRPRALRKRVRDGTLPPLLVMFVSGLDMFVLLDGHDRLRAALTEGTIPSLLVLWKVRSQPNPLHPERLEAALRAAEARRRARGDPEGLFATQEENRQLIAAFDDRATLLARTAAWPLAGGIAAWEREVRARGIADDHPIFRGEPPTTR